MSNKPPITLSRIDLERIEALLERLPAGEAAKLAALRAELDRAEVVEPAAMPAQIVTMNSTVTFEDEEQRRKAHPDPGISGGGRCAGHGVDPGSGGQRAAWAGAGQQIDWPTPDGRKRRLKRAGNRLPAGGGRAVSPLSGCSRGGGAHRRRYFSKEMR